MKKFFTLVAMALMAVGANAQELIAEVDFTTATEFTGWNQFGDGQEGSVELKAGEGLAITVGSQTGQLWQPQTMVIPDGSFNLEEDGNYKVVVVAKFPTAGTLQINMGSWSANDQATFRLLSACSRVGQLTLRVLTCSSRMVTSLEQLSLSLYRFTTWMLVVKVLFFMRTTSLVLPSSLVGISSVTVRKVL